MVVLHFVGELLNGWIENTTISLLWNRKMMKGRSSVAILSNCPQKCKIIFRFLLNYQHQC